MAINENFIFSDPRIQAGVIGIAQIRAAEEAARLQRQAQSQQSYTQANVARDNAAAERARNDAYLTQRERESARQDVTLNKDLELRRTEEENRRRAIEGRDGRIVADRDKAERAKAQEATLRQIAKNVNDPVPPTEWATNKVRFGPDLSQSQKDDLDQTWSQTREAVRLRFDDSVKRAAGWTQKLQAALSAITDDPKGVTRQGKIKTILDELTKSGQDDLSFDPVSGGFVSAYRRLREDPPKGPGTANQEIPEGIRAPQVIAPPKIESFDSILRNREPIQGGGFVGFDPSAMVPEIPTEQTGPSRAAFIAPAPLPPPAPPSPQPQQFGSDLRAWTPPRDFIPSTGSVGYYPPPVARTFQPVAPQAERPDPGSFLNFLQQSMPKWMYRPAFSEEGFLGPGGLAGQGVFGQAQAVAAPQFIPPPPFVPQYISTDSPPQSRFVPGYESATQGMNLAPPPFTPPPQMRIPPWLYSPIFGRNGLIGPDGLAGQGVYGQTNRLRY